MTRYCWVAGWRGRSAIKNIEQTAISYICNSLNNVFSQVSWTREKSKWKLDFYVFSTSWKGTWSRNNPNFITPFNKHISYIFELTLSLYMLNNANYAFGQCLKNEYVHRWTKWFKLHGLIDDWLYQGLQLWEKWEKILNRSNVNILKWKYKS